MAAQDRFGARNPNTASHGRQFDAATIEAVWRKGTPEPGYPSFRKGRLQRVYAARRIRQHRFAMGLGD